MLQLGQHSLRFFSRRWKTVQNMLCSHFPHVRRLHKATFASIAVIEGCIYRLWNAPVSWPGHPLPTLNLLQKAHRNLLGQIGIGETSVGNVDWIMLKIDDTRLSAPKDILVYSHSLCLIHTLKVHVGMNPAGFLLFFSIPCDCLSSTDLFFL